MTSTRGGIITTKLPESELSRIRFCVFISPWSVLLELMRILRVTLYYSCCLLSHIPYRHCLVTKIGDSPRYENIQYKRRSDRY